MRAPASPGRCVHHGPKGWADMDRLFIHSFIIHLHLPSTSSMPGTVLGTEHLMTSRIDVSFPSWGSWLRWKADEQTGHPTYRSVPGGERRGPQESKEGGGAKTRRLMSELGGGRGPGRRGGILGCGWGRASPWGKIRGLREGSGGEVQWQQGPGLTSCATLKNCLEGTGKSLTGFGQGPDGI